MRNYRAEALGWWSIPCLGGTIRASTVRALVIEGLSHEQADLVVKEPDIPRYYMEFFRGLQNGLFGIGPRVRVMLLSPSFGLWRLGPQRAQQLVTQRGWDAFASDYLPYVLVEVDRAYEWFSTWLDEKALAAWLESPPIIEALHAAQQQSMRRRMGNSRGDVTAASVENPLENGVRDWLSGVVAD